MERIEDAFFLNSASSIETRQNSEAQNANDFFKESEENQPQSIGEI
jgi:hypothetical protein